MVDADADADADVAIADIDTEMALSKIDALEDSGLTSSLSVYKLDVSQKTEVVNLFGKVRGDLGAIYGLVNCFHFKGNTRKLDTTSNFFTNFEDYPEEAWDLVHDANLKGTFLMSKWLSLISRKMGRG